MKKIVFKNKHNLKEKDINEVVKRVKVLLINSKGEILIGYSHDNYEFIGGHVEESETLTETIEREVLEETGIKLNVSNIKPFLYGCGYYKDWPKQGINRKTEIYYYEIKTDLVPDLRNTNYTEHELDGNFTLKFMTLEQLESEISIKKDNNGISSEMLKVLEVYKNN